MAYTYKIHSTEFREEQYEIFYDLLDGKNVVLGNQIKAIGDTELDESGIVKLMAQTIIPEFENREEHEPEEMYSKTEVERILVEKGYLTEEQEFDDLEVRT